MGDFSKRRVTQNTIARAILGNQVCGIRIDLLCIISDYYNG